MSTDPTTTTGRTVSALSWTRLPAAVDRRVLVAAWISFVTEILIIGTGGAVRLTGSGLGCQWPLCAPDSLVPLPGMGLHSAIEFGNRLMSGVVGFAALAVLILVWRMRRTRPELFTLAWVVVGGVLLQALVGGITVLADLNAGVVSFHFIASLTLVAATAAFLVCAHRGPRPWRMSAPRWFAALTWITAVMAVLTVLVGIVTTAVGPHSGDSDVIRRLGDPMVMAHVHSVPAYTLCALTAALLISTVVRRLPSRRWVLTLAALLILQVPLGVYQARMHLPALAVGAHMILAGLITAVTVAMVMSLWVRSERTPD